MRHQSLGLVLLLTYGVYFSFYKCPSFYNWHYFLAILAVVMVTDCPIEVKTDVCACIYVCVCVCVCVLGGGLLALSDARGYFVRLMFVCNCTGSQ